MTIAWNQADVGGGLASSGATLHMRNVILAGDAATTSGEECEITTPAPDIASSLWQGTTCGASATNGNQPATDALLVPLDFSCPAGISLELTRTHDLDPTSPALDTGIPLPGGNAVMDQRRCPAPARPGHRHRRRRVLAVGLCLVLQGRLRARQHLRLDDDRRLEARDPRPAAGAAPAR